MLSTDKDELPGVGVLLAFEEDTVVVNNELDADSRGSVVEDDPLKLAVEADEGKVLPTGVKYCDSKELEV